MAKAKAKTWTNIKGQYKKADGLEGEGAWFDKVRDELKELEAKGADVGAMMAEITTLKKSNQLHEDKISEQNALIKAREILILKFLDKNSLESLRDGDGGLFYKQDEPSFKILDRESVDKWVDEKGYSELRTINAQTLKGLLSKALKAGEDIPEGVDISFATLLRSPKP
jgi:hypothetical protein